MGVWRGPERLRRSGGVPARHPSYPPPSNREGLPEREPFQFNHAPSARWCARHWVPAVLLWVDYKELMIEWVGQLMN